MRNLSWKWEIMKTLQITQTNTYTHAHDGCDAAGRNFSSYGIEHATAVGEAQTEILKFKLDRRARRVTLFKAATERADRRARTELIGHVRLQ